MPKVKDQETLKLSRKVLANKWDEIVNNANDIQVQAKTGIDRSTVGAYKRGKFLPSLPVCAKIRKATGFDFNALLDEINNEIDRNSTTKEN